VTGDGRGAARAGRGAAARVRAAGEQARILAGVLAGIELGAWDRRIVEWLAGWDTCTALTVASLIARARAAGPAGCGR
jgi:hypothetical protein